MPENTESGELSWINRPNDGCATFIGVTIGVIVLLYLLIWGFIGFMMKKSSNEYFDKWYEEEYIPQEFYGTIGNINAFKHSECSISILVQTSKAKSNLVNLSFDCACVINGLIDFISEGDSVIKHADSPNLTFINTEGESLEVSSPFCRLLPSTSRIYSFFWEIFNKNKHIDYSERPFPLKSSNLFNNGNILLTGTIYGVADSNARLVIGGLPDSLKIDTLKKESVLSIFRDGKELDIISPAAEYQFVVDLGHKYLLKFNHPSYVQRSFLIDATGISDSTQRFKMETHVSMLTDKVVEPINDYFTVASYDSLKQEMLWDRDLYTRNMEKSLEPKVLNRLP